MPGSELDDLCPLCIEKIIWNHDEYVWTILTHRGEGTLDIILLPDVLELQVHTELWGSRPQCSISSRRAWIGQILQDSDTGGLGDDLLEELQDLRDKPNKI